jgi:hypothetical protein
MFEKQILTGISVDKSFQMLEPVLFKGKNKGAG